MPNRDHDDSPYNRHEGRFESPRDERDDYRSESLRSTRDWNRHDYRAGERNRDGNQYGSGYNPSRDDHDFRGGSRFDERSSYDRGYAQGDYGRGDQSGRAWNDDTRFRERLGSARPDWGRAGEYDRGREWGGGDSRSQNTLRGGWSSSRQQPYYGAQGNFGGSQEGSRDYARDWDRDYPRDRAIRSYDARDSQQRDESDWGEQLRHTGHQLIGRVKRAFRGPKGYKRSDERIREDVNDRLAQQDEFDPSEIEVRVENGEVTLTGSVRSRHEKFRAEEIADDVSGVHDVHNQLRLGTQPQQQPSAASATSTGAQPTQRNGRA